MWHLLADRGFFDAAAAMVIPIDFVAIGMWVKVIRRLEEGPKTEVVFARSSVVTAHMGFVELWLGLKAD